jgi:hypothetical protein
MEKLKLIVDDNNKIQLYVDGCLLGGYRALEIYWEVGEPITHKIEFITQAAKINRKYSMD